MTRAGARLPAGTVTFLFTDIERSTRTLASLGNERYADALHVHGEILRSAFERHGGVEVGMEGDSFFVAFPRAGDAVNASIDAQRALASGDQGAIRVRIGMHTGEALVRGGDYVGHDVHKAKRISDAGHGGQILLSQTTRDIVRGQLPDGVDVKSLGPHRFKDLAEPQPVFQIVAAGLDETFPPLRTLDVRPQNLPVQLTSFVGRTSELDDIRKMLGAHRLVTLTGVGGSGKTRLAVQAAADELDGSPDGVFFCDLSPLSDEDAIVPTIVRGIGLEVGELMSRPTLETVRGYLAERHVLLLLDNCEHLIDAVAALAEDLLRSCPNLRILATSREALEVAGEHTWSVPSLDATADGVQLFVERAASVRGSFALNESNAEDIRAICSRLDGMPLAIELAAAQIAHLAPHQIVTRLDDRFALLTGGRRRVQRQQTLQATMDWSWDLLHERDRSLLARLTVFQGGCTLESAQAICGDGLDVLTGLRSLVSKSLVATDDDGQTIRYRLLETVRIFAEEKLVTSGDAERFRSAHRDYYQRWTEAYHHEVGPFLSSLPGSELEREQDNIRAALRWSETQGRLDLVARILCFTFAQWRFNYAEGTRRLSAALETDLDPLTRGRLLACFATHQAASALRTPTLQAKEAIELLGDDSLPWLYLALQTAANGVGIEAIATRDAVLADEAVQLARCCAEVGDRLDPAWGVYPELTLVTVLLMQLRYAEAAEACVACVRRSESVGQSSYIHQEGLSAIRRIRPDLWTRELDDAHRAGIDAYERANLRIPPFVALDLFDEGLVDDAYEVLARVVDQFSGIAPERFFRVPLLYSGIIAAELEDWERAARLFAAAMQPGVLLSAAAYALYVHWLPRIRAELDGDRARALRAEGHAMSLDQALAYALERP